MAVLGEHRRGSLRFWLACALLACAAVPVHAQGEATSGGTVVDDLGLESFPPDGTDFAPAPFAQPTVSAEETDDAIGAADAQDDPVVPERADAVSPPDEDAAQPQDNALSGLEIADEQPDKNAVSDVPQPGAVTSPAPPKTEQGFQEMLDRRGGTQAPTVDSVKKTVAENEGQPFNPSRIRSLFFTYWQHEALIDAKRSRGNVRPPTQSELNALGAPGDKGRPANRDISLNGIVFVTDADWTIWLNGMRVTPSAIPREVLDLRVYKEYIEVKWLDDYTNQIYPIRLRAHQRFNLDTRIFLPG